MKNKKLWGIALAVASAFPEGLAGSPDVRVELRTSWSRPPVFVEVLETIVTEVSQPDAFFTLLNALTDPSLEPQHIVKRSDTPKKIYDVCLWTALQAGFFWEVGALAEAEMSIALHSALPAVEASYQYYLDREAGRVRTLQKDGLCESWVDWYGHVVCDGETLAQVIEAEEIEGVVGAMGYHSTSPSPRLLPFDHVLPAVIPGVNRPPRTAILYGSPLSKNFRELHDPLYRISKGPSPHVEYVFRHVPPVDLARPSEQAPLSGYGVALDLKKMEYLALDDRLQGSTQSQSSAQADSEVPLEVDPIIALIHQYPEVDNVSYSEALSESELSQIALQTTQLVYDSEDALATLKQISQNFPKYASAIARRVTVQEELDEEAQVNRAKAQPGVSMVWLNGLVVPETEMNPFALLRLMKKERNIIRATEALGLSSSQALDFITHRAIGLAQSDSGVLDGISDASDRPEGEGVVVWWNDVETDKRYEGWNPALNMLLTPMYPGQFPNVKLNLFNIVLAIDLSQTSSVNFIAGAVNMIIQRGFPFRFGVVPLVETEQGAQMARLFYWLIEHVGRTKTMSLFSKVAQLHVPAELLTYNVDWNVLRAEFNALTADLEEGADFDSIINPPGGLEEYAEALEKAKRYAKRLSADLGSASQGHAFVNGKHFELNDGFLRNMQIEANQQLQHLQEKVYLGEINDEDSESMATYFYDLPSSSKRRNKFIYPTDKSSSTGGLHIVNLMDVYQTSGFPISSGSFIHPPNSQRLNASTIVVADFDSHDGVALFTEVLRSLTPGSKSRYTFVHNPAVDTSGTEPTLASILGYLITTATLKKVTPAQLLQVVDTGALDKAEGQTVLQLESTLSDILGELPELDSAAYEQYIQASNAVVDMLNIAPGARALVVNGRIVGPLGHEEFVAEDCYDLINYEIRKRIGPVVDALTEVMNITDEYDRDAFNGLISLSSSLISSIHLPDPSEAGLTSTSIRPRRRNYQLLAGNYTKFEYGDNSTAPFHFGVILNPLSEAAQKWTALLEWLIRSPGVFVELHVNPPKYKELPLKRFYRYNIQAVPEFDDQEQEVTPAVSFSGLPKEPIYTLAMDVAPSWHVRPREASHDLDNILLSSLTPSSNVHALFNLDYLVIEGHAREEQTMQPPRGLQLQLVNSNDTAVADTLVVANLGYLQFRAKPGVYQFEIRPGRGREIFRLSSAGTEGWDSPSVEKIGNEITVMSFEGLTLYPRTFRVEGMEDVDVLAADEPDEHAEVNLLDKVRNGVFSLFGTKETSQALEVASDGQAEINIFTVASGLLYERFASIMILSVLRNTNSTVKFWFIENFLSPSFLEFIPHFAEAYNFQYELVTYKWPSWLRAQTEKQRIIWAYKILFLDVLFPMDLKKVIFVDADQIVRADLKELVELDLHGAPYGYTPMGDDNTEMEGFRFWKTGYWRDSLRGRPYHISALYVVDLVRFRQIAAGDILRAHYQQLSQDPNSLANLDQDLPNNLQREVPIFSLPEDWLWCETWCSKDRFDRAKTIDLCQNPLTKEPKLARAKHIPEWEDYDSEIARFAKQLSEKGIIHSGMADADASVLADVGIATTATGSDAEGPLDDALQPEEEPDVGYHRKDEL